MKVSQWSKPSVSGEVHLEFHFIILLHGWQDLMNACNEAHSLIIWRQYRVSYLVLVVLMFKRFGTNMSKYKVSELLNIQELHN